MVVGCRWHQRKDNDQRVRTIIDGNSCQKHQIAAHIRSRSIKMTGSGCWNSRLIEVGTQSLQRAALTGTESQTQLGSRTMKTASNLTEKAIPSDNQQGDHRRSHETGIMYQHDKQTSVAAVTADDGRQGQQHKLKVTDR